MSERYGGTPHYWETWDDVPVTTRVEASVVKMMRVDTSGNPLGGCTWRAVASNYAEMADGDWGSNQLAGWDICEKARVFLGDSRAEWGED